MSTKQLNELEIDQLRPLLKEILRSIDAYVMEETAIGMRRENGEYDEEKLRLIAHHVGEQLTNY